MIINFERAGDRSDHYNGCYYKQVHVSTEVWNNDADAVMMIDRD
jgi:hypothetical protein